MTRRVLLIIGLLVLITTPAHAQVETAGTIDGTTISGTYNSADGRPAMVVGFRLPPDLLANVKEFRCRPGDRVLNEGPDRNWECILNPAAAMVPFTMVGINDWPDTITVVPFTSYNGRLPYEFDDPVEFASPVVDVPPAPDEPPPAVDSDAVAAGPPAVTDTDDSGGSSLNWLWGGLLGVGVVMGVGGLVLTRNRGLATTDVMDPLIAAAAGFAPAGQLTVESLIEEFDVLEDKLADAADTALQELAAFEHAYTVLFADAMSHLDNYAKNYKPLIPQMKAIWDEFADREWAVAKAEFAQQIVDGVGLAMGGMSAVKGGLAALEAAEVAYALEYGHGAALKLGTALHAAKAGSHVVLSGKPVGNAAAKLAALRRQPGLAFEFSAAKGANAVVKTATNNPLQNEKWIRSWLNKLGVANAQLNCNCQLATKAGTQMVAKGTANVPFYLNSEGYAWAKGQGMVFSNNQLATNVGKPLVTTNFADLQKALAAQPHGSQVWIIVSQEYQVVEGGKTVTKSAAHIFNGVKLNKTTFFFDVQSGALSTNPAKVAAASGYTTPVVQAVNATGQGF